MFGVRLLAPEGVAQARRLVPGDVAGEEGVQEVREAVAGKRAQAVR